MYKITSSEERNETASEFETKSMLFAMNYYSNSEDIYWFVIDFFNDVSGVNDLANKCFDIQSKGVNDISPSLMGRYLVTLFKNYLSEFNFADFVLFMKSVSPTIRGEIGSKNCFTISELSESISECVKNALKDEAQSKTYIDNKEDITDENIDNFLGKVSFVVDSYSNEQYIKDAVKMSSKVKVDDLYLRKIFKEIRDKQSSKKNNNCEGELLTSIDCFLKYDKYFKKEDIQNLILSRICFNSNFVENKGIPVAFNSVYNSIDETIRKETFEDCRNDVFRVLFNKNNTEAYWDLFSTIVRLTKKHPTYDADKIYSMIDYELIKRVQHLNVISCKYFIALIMEGLND